MRKILLFLFLVFCYLLFVTSIRAAPPEPNPTSTATVTPVPSKDPAATNFDKNPCAVRGCTPITGGVKNFIDFGHAVDKKLPDLYGLLNRDVQFGTLYNVNSWNQVAGKAGDAIPRPKDLPDQFDYAPAVGIKTSGGESVRVPKSGYEVTSGYQAVILYADKNSVAIKYTPADSVAAGYTIHLYNINVKQNILDIYQKAVEGGRLQLPAVPAGFEVALTKDGEMITIMRDTGDFMDIRWREWWVNKPSTNPTPTPVLPDPKLIDVPATEVPGGGRVGLNGQAVGPAKNYGAEQQEYQCDRVVYHPKFGGQMPTYIKDNKDPPEPEMLPGAKLNSSTLVPKGLHCGLSKGEPIVIEERSPFTVFEPTVCDKRVNKDFSGKFPEGTTGVWWMGEVQINYDMVDPQGNPRNIYEPFAQKIGNELGGIYSPEFTSESHMEENEKFLENFGKQLESGIENLATQAQYKKYLDIQNEISTKSGVLKKLVPQGEQDVMKCEMVKWVKSAGRFSIYNSGFTIDKKPVGAYRCPPTIDTTSKSGHPELKALVYQGKKEDWEKEYGTGWKRFPLIPNEMSNGVWRMNVCGDREYLYSFKYPELFRMGLSANKTWEMLTSAGDKKNPLPGTQEGFYAAGYEDMRKPYDSIIKGLRGVYGDIPQWDYPMPTPPPFYNSPDACRAPRPENDTGIVFHGPISGYTDAWKGEFDKVMKLAQSMQGKWMVMFPGDTEQAGFAFREAKEFGMMPVIRPNVKIDAGNVDWAGYVRAGQKEGFANPYIQIYNEPGDDREWNSKSPDIYTFAHKWVDAAKAIVASGGKPGLQVQSRADFYAVLDVLPKNDPLWHEVWFSNHGYAENNLAPDHTPTFEDEKSPNSIQRWRDVFQDGLGFTLNSIETEGGWEMKPPEGGGVDGKPTAEEQQRIADYTKKFMDSLRSGYFPNGEKVPDDVIGLNPAFLLSGLGVPQWKPGDEKDMHAYFWTEGYYDWSKTIQAMQSQVAYEREMTCNASQKKRIEQQDRKMQQLQLRKDQPSLITDAKNYFQKVGQVSRIIYRKSALSKKINVIAKSAATWQSQWNLSDLWPKVRIAFAQTMTLLAKEPDTGIIRTVPRPAAQVARTPNPGKTCDGIKATLNAEVKKVSDGQYSVCWQMTGNNGAGRTGCDFGYTINAEVDGKPGDSISVPMNGGQCLRHNQGEGQPMYDCHVPGARSLTVSAKPGQTIKVSLDITGLHNPNEDKGVSCQVDLDQAEECLIDASGETDCNVIKDEPYTTRQTSACDDGSQCCLTGGCDISCNICNSTQVPPSSTTVLPESYPADHVIIGANWTGSTYADDPVRFRYKINEWKPGTRPLPDGCSIVRTRYTIVPGTDAYHYNSARCKGPEDDGFCGQLGADACGGDGYCGDIKCEAVHTRTIDVWNTVPFLGSAWMQIADPIYGYAGALAKSSTVKGKNAASNDPVQGDAQGCLTKEDEILDMYGNFYPRAAASYVGLNFANSFGNEQGKQFAWGVSVKQTSDPNSKITWYKLGGTCNAQTWWSEKVLNPWLKKGGNASNLQEISVPAEKSTYFDMKERQLELLNK